MKSNGLYVNWKIAKPYMTVLIAQSANECKANPACTERGWGAQHHLAVHQQAWDWQQLWDCCGVVVLWYYAEWKQAVQLSQTHHFITNQLFFNIKSSFKFCSTFILFTGRNLFKPWIWLECWFSELAIIKSWFGHNSLKCMFLKLCVFQ